MEDSVILPEVIVEAKKLNTSKRKSVCILLDPCHGRSVPGKKSPDSSLLEWKWGRMMCNKLLKRLQDNDYRCIKITDSDEEIGLSNRCTIANQYAGYFGKKKTLFFSIHVNAAGSDGKWHNADGWCVFVAKTASDYSKKFAELLYDEIEARDIKTRKPKPKQKYWEANFTVIAKTSCPAALCESGFMDNKKECALLLTKEHQEKLLDAYYNAIVKYVDYVIEQENL